MERIIFPAASERERARKRVLVYTYNLVKELHVMYTRRDSKEKERERERNGFDKCTDNPTGVESKRAILSERRREKRY